MASLDSETLPVPDHATQQTTENHGTLKRKRAKYTVRACLHCQRRKIKCDGADPCRPCLAREQPCHRFDGDADDSKNRQSFDNTASDPMISFLLRRLAQLEERLERPQPTDAGQQPEKPIENAPQQLESPRTSDSPTASLSKRMRESQGVMWDDGLPFAGEISVRYSLELMEDRLSRLGVDRPDRPSSPQTQPLTPALRPSTPEQTSLDSRPCWRRTGNIRQLLDSHGLVLNLGEWKTHFETYLAEVHPLYPFLFPPSLRDTFDHLCTSYSSGTPLPISSDKDLELRLAIIFLCLATGRCTTATRKQNKARHSAGWSLYCVANELIGDVLHLCGNSASSMLQLQTLCSIVVYLFRLDANERAQNVLALAISHAHSLGINRRSTSEKMTVFEDESFRRIWWCIYVLDRRLCLETGRPFLVMDMNTDAALPSDVDESWMSRYGDLTERTADWDPSSLPSSGNVHSSPVTYLKAMVGYSRISAKVWEAMYAAPVAKQPLNNLLREYVENSLDEWRQTLPTALIWNYESNGMSSFAANPGSRQRFILHLRYHYMKLMIRKPALQQGFNDLDRNVTCIGLADLIISDFLHWHEELDILKFPYVRYLLGATLASLSILISEPSLREAHTSFIVSAVELLKKSCYQSWVSGKTTRTIARVYSLVQSMRHFGRNFRPGGDSALTIAPRGHSDLKTKALENPIQTEPNVKSDELQGEATGIPFFSSDPTGLSQLEPLLSTPDQGGYGLLPDFTWPDLIMEEFDFEASLRGRDMVEATTDTWLDSLSFTPIITQSHSS